MTLLILSYDFAPLHQQTELHTAPHVWHGHPSPNKKSSPNAALAGIREGVSMASVGLWAWGCTLLLRILVPLVAWVYGATHGLRSSLRVSIVHHATMYSKEDTKHLQLTIEKASLLLSFKWFYLLAEFGVRGRQGGCIQ